MEEYRILKKNNKWYIEAYTEEFGYVLLLKKGGVEPFEFESEERALNEIKFLDITNFELCL